MTKADTPTIRLDATPSGLLVRTIFMPNALPAVTMPNLFWHDTGTKYEGLHTWWLAVKE